MKLKPETLGFVRGGMLFLEPPWRWRIWQRDIWTCCAQLSDTHRPEKMSWVREATPLEITEWLLRQSPPVTRGLVMNMPASGTSVEHRLFQAAIHRDYAMTIKYGRGSQRGNGMDRRWLLEIGRYTYEDCIRRARANLYLARRLNREQLTEPHRSDGG